MRHPGQATGFLSQIYSGLLAIFSRKPVFHPYFLGLERIESLGKLKQNAIKLQSPLANFLGGL